MAIVKKDWGTSTIEGEDIDKGMVVHIYKQIDAIKWEPHPVNENVRMGVILTKKDDNVQITAFKARVPKG